MKTSSTVEGVGVFLFFYLTSSTFFSSKNLIVEKRIVQKNRQRSLFYVETPNTLGVTDVFLPTVVEFPTGRLVTRFYLKYKMRSHNKIKVI